MVRDDAWQGLQWTAGKVFREVILLHQRHKERNIMEKRTEKTAEEKHEKRELKNEEAELVAGGAGFAKVRCPGCGSHFFTMHDGRRVCDSCGREY